MTGAQAASPTAASRWEDYLDVFISPAQLFRRRADGAFGQALLVLVVLVAIMFFGTRPAMQPIMDGEFNRRMAAQMKAHPEVKPEQIEAGRKWANTLAPVGVIVGLPIVLLVLGTAVWIAGKAVGGKLTYAQGATIATFAMFPKLVEGVAGAVQALLMDEGSLNSRFSVSLGVGRFLDPDATNAALLALLGRVDLFTLWITALVAIGLRVMAKVGTGQAVAAGGLVWLLGALPTVLPALLSG
jgi:hypothetical protein